MSRHYGLDYNTATDRRAHICEQQLSRTPSTVTFTLEQLISLRRSGYACDSADLVIIRQLGVQRRLSNWRRSNRRGSRAERKYQRRIKRVCLFHGLRIALLFHGCNKTNPRFHHLFHGGVNGNPRLPRLFHGRPFIRKLWRTPIQGLHSYTAGLQHLS